MARIYLFLDTRLRFSIALVVLFNKLYCCSTHNYCYNKLKDIYLFFIITAHNSVGPKRHRQQDGDELLFSFTLYINSRNKVEASDRMAHCYCKKKNTINRVLDKNEHKL